LILASVACSSRVHICDSYTEPNPEFFGKSWLLRDFSEINGTEPYYEVAGRGDPLVLALESYLDNRIWDGQFGVFAKRYRVIRYNFRGNGKSALLTSEPR
jgi:hypothetical protein